MVGRTVSHYRVVEKLGEGGMGVVYKAHDTQLDRFVALKVLPPGKVADPERKRRFVREAKSASALSHPNIVTIHEICAGTEADFIVMEHVDGRTLDKIIVPGGLRPPQVLRLAVQIADALATAHAAGIIHRDLKPSNVIVTNEGRVKVLDFGLAKLLEPPEISPEGTTLTAAPLTDEGTVMGTAAYMSPEQAEGRKLDGRSDIFSLGSVLYEMLTGRRPFTGDSRLSILTRIVSADPTPPVQLNASVPPELEKIVLRCLRKDPARRYQTMADLKVALEDAVEETGSGRQVRQATGRRRWIWAALLPLPLLVAGFFGWRTWKTPENTQPLKAVPLTTLPGVELSPSFSPDGNHVAFSWYKQESQDLYVQLIGSGTPLRLTTDPLADYNPVWSPDGRQIAFLRSEPPAPTGPRNRELRLIPPLGGPDRKLADIRSHDFFPIGAYLAWSADSKSLVVTDSPGEGQPNALFAVSVETGEKRQLTTPRAPVLADTSPAVSPDGRSLIFVRKTSLGAGELHLLPLRDGLVAAGDPVRLTSAALRADHPAWIPDGKEIVFGAKGSLWRLAVPGGTEPTRIPYVGEDGLMPSVSRPQAGKSARLVYVRSFIDFNFWRIETPAPGAPSTSAPVLAIASTKEEYHIKFSPDGRRVAFNSSRSGDPEIWLSDPDGSNAVKLTSMGAQETMCPSWSHDGQQILFSSNPEGEFDLYVIAASGGKPRRLTSHPAIDVCGSFSPDGKWIYFSSMRSGDYRIWKMPAAGGDAVQVSPNQGGAVYVSRDGKYIYYNPVIMPGAPVWRMPVSGGEPVKILEGMVWFNFALLDKGAYFIDRLGSETRLQYLNFATGKPATVARNLGEVSAGLTATPDGRTILYTRMDSSAYDLMLVENFR